MGGDIHTAYQAHGSLAFLLECGPGKGQFQPSSQTRETILTELWPGVKEFLALPISLQGHVYLGEEGSDAATPVTASIEVEGSGLSLGEQSYTTPSSGRYHLWLPAGKYSLHVKTVGEVATDKVIEVTIGNTGSSQDIYLASSPPPPTAAEKSKASLTVSLPDDEENPLMLMKAGVEGSGSSQAHAEFHGGAESDAVKMVASLEPMDVPDDEMHSGVGSSAPASGTPEYTKMCAEETDIAAQAYTTATKH